ncbi:unnamed protein product [Paramecium sonneborni]|uniref:Uncharacterized protein n=1 Tax=Paramecium sonneborni TaxID=65129 RepID=A0A8S1KG90_9CILI|nr:unnamed protein product [Paramecium sonneborni]
MKILNIDKLQNQQNNITQKLLQEFADKNSIEFTELIKQKYEDRQVLKQIIIQYEPIVNKIYAEVLGFKMQQMKDNLDIQSINTREQVIAMMIHIEEVLEEIEKHFQIPYNKQYFEEAIYEITIPIIDQDEGTNNQECWCKKCTIS